MVDKKDVKGKEPQPKISVVYTAEELEYREDLQQKLLTLEHVKSILIGRDDSPVFLHQIQDLYNIVEKWYVGAVMAKRGEQNVPAAGKEDGSGEGSEPSDSDT